MVNRYCHILLVCGTFRINATSNGGQVNSVFIYFLFAARSGSTPPAMVNRYCHILVCGTFRINASSNGGQVNSVVVYFLFAARSGTPPAMVDR